jgi:hypothetical protein
MTCASPLGRVTNTALLAQRYEYSIARLGQGCLLALGLIERRMPYFQTLEFCQLAGRSEP